MRLLPPILQPPEAAVQRRHRPPRRRRSWREFRACLRWDFGFTCVFCLLHEADWHWGAPGEGLGVTTVEHVVARSKEPESAGTYENCLYACRHCNVARGARPRQVGEGRLLDPTRDAWAAHFEAVGDRLRPRAGDADARYTHRTYDLDDPLKMARRRKRREFLQLRLRQSVTLRRLVEDMTLRAEEMIEAGDPRGLELVLEAEALNVDMIALIAEAVWLEVVPTDAPHTCRCDGPRSLPAWLDQQALEL